MTTGKTITLTRWTLGCFYLSAIMSNVAMNMSGQIALEILLSILWGTYQEVELLDHMVILFLIFEEQPYCFPQQLHHFTLPPEI